MKVALFSIFIFLFSLVIILAWFSYPWSLGGQSVQVPPLHIEPESMVNNEEFPSIIKIQTWNLAFLYGEGSEGTGYIPRNKTYFENQLSKLVQEISTSSPDIICLQEIDFESARSADINQAVYLATKASYPYVAEAVSWDANYIPFPYWPISNHFGRMKSGGAVISKYPITSQTVHLLKKPQGQPWWYNLFYLHRYFQEVEIELGEKKIKLINLHLEAFDKQDRESQAKELVRIVLENRVDFIAGDFNMTPESATKKSKFLNSADEYENDKSFSEMMKSGLLEVIPESIYSIDEARYFTFPASKPDRRLDYIFYNSNFKMIKAEVLPSALSDHLPLRASFQISLPKFSPYSQ